MNDSHTVIPIENDEAATEYDIGKVIESDVSVKDLSRDAKFKILTLEVNPDVPCYPRRAYNSGSSRQFQPTWKKQYPWLHYSKHLDGFFAMHVCSLHQIQ